MGDLTLAYKVRSYSTGTLGRAICNARTHHFVADDAGGEEVGAGELFLSGISACAVNMVERLAKEQHIPLQWMDVGGVRCHPGAFRDVGRQQGPSRWAGRNLEAALTALWFGRRGDR